MRLVALTQTQKFLRLFICSLLVPCAISAPAMADESFKAIVNSDTAFVHSGPDAKDYYATVQLKRGDKVEVVREDFGGWYMIKPPANSFSWIRSDFVDRTGKQGVVNVDNAVDRIGSTVHDGDPFVVHRLSQGATVKIISEESRIDKSSGVAIKMLKIKPPNGEFRYINKRDVVAASQFAEQPDILPDGPDRQGTISLTDPKGVTQITPDPFADPTQNDKKNDLTNGPSIPLAEPTARNDSNIPGSLANRLPGSASEGVKMPAPSFDLPQPLTLTPSGQPTETRKSKDAWAVLEVIDERFRQMIKQPVSRWNISTVRQEYSGLETKQTSRSLSQQIKLRLEAVDRYQRLSDEYADVRRIISETERRDEQIRKSFLTRQQTVSMENTPRTRVVRPTTPTVAPPRTQPPAPTQPNRGAPSNVRRPADRRFDGAGIIRRVGRAGLPAHALVAPNGRLLAYLQGAPGIDLDRYVGRAFGLNGPRGFRADLNADFIDVRRMTPVVLSR
jgi:hypothetical protein